MINKLKYVLFAFVGILFIYVTASVIKKGEIHEKEKILINSFKSRDYKESFKQASEIKKDSKTAKMILCTHYLFELHASFNLAKAEDYCLKAGINKKQMLIQAQENYCEGGLLAPKNPNLCSYFKNQLVQLESKF